MSHDGLIRKGFGLRREVAPELERDYASALVRRAREHGNELVLDGLTVRLAEEFGFCYGVERAVDYAYETRRKFPDRRCVITGEIIHNPRVNARLRELGFEFLDGTLGSTITVDDLGPEDVVLLPAFGVTTELLERLRRAGCVLVDTTCGSVLAVWKNVERYARDGFTCLIHGKWQHEETRATASRALIYPEGRYLIVLDLEEAEFVARYIEHGGDRDAFARRFADAVSPGFDPDRHLERIGMANQTTMLSSESMQIAGRIGRAMVARWGREEAARRFRSFDTICSATQDRQDAVLAMMRTPPDVMLVIGGFNSSNTGHLAEICAGHCPTWHVEGAEDLLALDRIRHKPVDAREPVMHRGPWLPDTAREIGLTAGASTPDREIGRVIARLLELRGIDPPA
ncbi:MAG: 4-hydroxy-3-methylbut-2-enyl diphosphate reductase [Acidobacteriota bacterium]|nr:MAG: 4-hydroxy-3-methylbut-2-enyl diphosphate reductase [Acidobacteriota bacterium]